MKKWYWLVILCAAFALMVVALLPFTMHTAHAEGETSGQCGDNLYWSFDESTGTLTIGGVGQMPDYDYYSDSHPWKSFRAQIEEVIVLDGVTNIGSFAFGGYNEEDDSVHFPTLKHVTIPDSVTSIGEGAFMGCTAMKTVTIGNGLTSIGELAFSGCTKLTSITIPNGVTSIGVWAFSRCSTLTSITIPDSVTSIGGGAFSGCTGLQTITIPDGVTSIGFCAFEQCTGLTSVTIGNGLTSIDDLAFSGCTKLTSITIPNGVTRIGAWAFSRCSALTSITMPCSASIGIGAFTDCVSVMNVHLTKGTGTMPDYLVDVDDHENKTSYMYEFTPWYVSRNNALTVTLDEGIQEIGRYAFYACRGFSKITIPDSVTKIGQRAFIYCRGMTELTLPCNESFGHEAFYCCTGLTDIRLTKGTGRMPDYSNEPGYEDPNQLSTPWYANRNNSITVSLDEGIRHIGAYAFSGCYGLTSITIPDSVTSIGEDAFSNCKGLTSITIPDSVTYLGSYVFSECTGLTSATIGNSVTGLGFDTFFNCLNLTSVTIGNCVTYISYRSFYNCTALTDVYYNGTESEREGRLTVYDENECLLSAQWHYLTLTKNVKVVWNENDVQYKGTTPFVIANGSAQKPRFTVTDLSGHVIDPSHYNYTYRENVSAGTGYVVVIFTGDGEAAGQRTLFRGSFKIYLQPTTTTTIENVSNGIKLTWNPVPGAAGYVIYRRAWSSTTNGWTTFERWNNTTGTTYIDGADANHKVYAGTRYQYGIKAYFSRRLDPVTNTYIGGNVGDNFNLGEVGPLKTTVRITTRTLNSVTAGTKQMTVKWGASSVFTGYQIKYATDANFTKNVKAIKISDPKTAQTVISGLTSGTTYYVTVRSYHEFNGMTYFGEWSNVLSCKVK